MAGVLDTPDPVLDAPAEAGAAWAAFERLRRGRPRVHVLTSPVAMAISANALLAAGAVPSMTQDPEAVADFVAGTGALVVNLGMLDPLRRAAIPPAVAAARAHGRPWLLDPVKVDRAGGRHRFAVDLLGQGPAAVRANRGEAAVLADGGDPAAYAALAERHGFALAVTGETDFVTDGARAAVLHNGHPLMDRVTAVGCAASALAGAFLAVEEDPFAALRAALLVYGVAGEIAGGIARGPGGFEGQLLDALYGLDETTFKRRARVEA
ncbi:MAG: hydroxyethylthiazole kinase [Geminicoccaceae bacterium]|nr:hydroxyethylthiazole kinase [Geminicoccaceae bacterium]